jgi:hypothetical protein
MAENLDPPRIAGRHFFVDLKTMHFGRNGSSNSFFVTQTHTDSHSHIESLFLESWLHDLSLIARACAFAQPEHHRFFPSASNMAGNPRLGYFS